MDQLKMCYVSIVAIFCMILVSVPMGHSNQENQEINSHSNTVLHKRSVRLCGVKLINTMKTVCNHCYRMPKNRRSIRSTDRRTYIDTLSGFGQNDEASVEYINSYFQKRFAPSPNNAGNSNGVGIADKCCLNQCGWKDLKSYCCKKPKLDSDSN